MKLTLLVLAAGMGSRYGGMKQLDHLGSSGETIMDYSVYDALRAGFGKVVFVIRKSFEDDFRKNILDKLAGHVETALAFQELDDLPGGHLCPNNREKPWGTGHAIWVAREVIEGPFAVINADDFYGKEAFAVMADYLGGLSASGKKGQYAMCGYALDKTLSEYGRVSRGVCLVDENENLKKVTEHTDIGKNKDDHIISYYTGTIFKPDTAVSMNFWGFSPDIFDHLEEKLKRFLATGLDQPKSEFYIPMVVDELIGEGKASVRVLPADSHWFGVTYREDKEVAVASLRQLVLAGVYPDNLWDQQ